MTLDGEAYGALVAAYPHAFAKYALSQVDGLALPPRTAVIIDATAGLEPSTRECGLYTQREHAAWAAEHAGERRDDSELEPATWREYALARTRAARSYVCAPARSIESVVVAVDIGTPPAKYPEHAARYGSAAGASEAAATTTTTATTESAPKRRKKAPVETATDDEADAALASERLPRDWKKHRGNKRFLRGVITRVLDAIVDAYMQLADAADADADTAPAALARNLIVVGDPRVERDRRHVPVMYRRLAAAGGGVGTEVQRLRLEYPEWTLAYLEADFSVVHLANVLAAQGLHTLVRAVDGDTLFSLLLSAPRRAPADGIGTANTAAAKAPRLCYMLREVAGAATLINVNALAASLAGDASALLGETVRPRYNIEHAVACFMMLGNDYVFKFMPQVGFKRLFAALRAHADELAPLVDATPAHVLRADKRCAHEVRVDRSLLHRLVDHVYSSTDALAAHRPSAESVDVAHALLSHALNYFANAANPWHVGPDIFARGPSGLSLHGYELVDPALPPSRDNVRHAERVEPC